MKYAREERGISQAMLSIKSGIPQRSVSVYERDKTVPTLLAAAKLAKALGVSLDWLAGRGDLDA
jgi:transcriptional regulator with XRE-family HTH domain